ncbi:MAG TPA: hypothetical protein VG755_19730 [Nannocystaceae bacterium]|nr:hypothetical protein [Nannocystaceae bacterium]
MTKTRKLGSLMFALAFGCAHQPTPTSDTFTGSFASTIPDLEKRAPHDLNCAAGQLTYKDLGPLTVGVDGCGNRATYKWVQTVGWVMDSARQPALGASPTS